MSERPEKRSGVWAEVKDFHEPKSGATVVIKERIRGAPAYSIQVIHIEKEGQGNKFIPFLTGPVPDLKSHDGKEVYLEDVIFSLIGAARQWILERQKTAASKKSEKTSGKGPSRDRKGGKPRKERKTEGGLSALARKDAQTAGHEYTSPSARKKEKRAQAKSSAEENT